MHMITWIIGKLRYIGGVCLALATCCLMAEVIVRRVYTSIFPIDEIGGMCMFVLCLVAAPYAFHTGRFLRVRVLLDRVPQRVRGAVEAAHYMFAAFFTGYATYLWGKMTCRSIKSGDYLLETGVPYWVLHVIGLVSWILLCSTIVIMLFKDKFAK